MTKTIIRAHKIRLYPNNVEETYFKKACGVARKAYNWGLDLWMKKLEKKEKVKEADIRKELNKIKYIEFPWMLEVTKCAPQLAIKNNLNNAFKNYFNKKAGFPRFHKKGIDDSFSISNDQFEVKGKYVRIPKLGLVKMSEELRYTGKLIAAVISRKAGKWYIAIQVEFTKELTSTNKNQVVGVDLGVKNLATLSNGIIFEGPKPSKKYEDKLKRLNQVLARKVGTKEDEKKSNNFWKACIRLHKIHKRIANIRLDNTHKLTSYLVNNYALIGIEDLSVSNMLKDPNLAFYIADMSFFEFKRQLIYKAEITNTKVVIADRYFASSKTCNICDEKIDNLSLDIRNWKCPKCQSTHDRDINAAINLMNYAVKHN